MKILVTGGAGYLGSVLLPKLLVRGHEVRVIDVGYFGLGHLRGYRPAVEVVRDDIRRVGKDRTFAEQLFEGVDCVIHLAAISNDPSAELQPELTEEVNFEATCALADMAKERQARFVFSSSCSVYGASDEIIDEDGATAPLTHYAVSKVRSDAYLESIATDDWTPVVLRNGTLFGFSPRMRFDLVINIFGLHSTLYNEIRIFGSGEHWRPFLHVSDCAAAFLHFAELPKPRYVRYNIMHENLRVVDVAELFTTLNPRLKVSYVDLPQDDLRNYRVTGERAREDGFETQHSIRLGAEQVCEAIANGTIPDPESLYYRNAKWLSELTQIGGKSHADLAQLMETIGRMPGVAR